MINQPQKILRLCLVASISFASLNLVACGDSDNKPTASTVPDSNTDKPTDTPKYQMGSYNDSITPKKAVSWTPAHTHENIRKIEIQGDNLVIMHRWHNGIINVPLATLATTPDFSATPIGFGVITTSGYNKPSTSDDYIVGAGENEIQDVWFSNDNSAMFALSHKPSVDSHVDGEDSFGLFKVAVKTDGTIASETINNRTVYHRMSGVKRVGEGMTENDLNITKALPLADGQVVAFDSNHNAVAVYSNDLVRDDNNSFEIVDAVLESWISNAHNLYLLLKNNDGTFTLQQRKLNDLGSIFNHMSVESIGYLVKTLAVIWTTAIKTVTC